MYLNGLHPDGRGGGSRPEPPEPPADSPADVEAAEHQAAGVAGHR